MRFAEIIREHEEDEREESIESRAIRIGERIAAYAKRLKVRATLIPFKNPYGFVVGLELNEFYAATPGTGAGTKIMNMLCQLADEADISVYVRPEGPRSKDFYMRFGFEKSPNVFSTLVRHPPLPDYLQNIQD